MVQEALLPPPPEKDPVGLLSLKLARLGATNLCVACPPRRAGAATQASFGLELTAPCCSPCWLGSLCSPCWSLGAAAAGVDSPAAAAAAISRRTPPTRRQ